MNVPVDDPIPLVLPTPDIPGNQGDGANASLKSRGDGRDAFCNYTKDA
jgi:hypothetical protein